MAKEKFSLKMFTSPRIVQVLVGLLFITMGLIGFSSSSGLSGDFAGELAGMFDIGDKELVKNGVSAILLVCGIVLLASLWVKGISAKFISVAQISILIIWLALIIVLDFLAINFGSFDGAQWFVWIEQIVIHLIVLVSIVMVRES
jgi:hypothetical protein